MKKSILIVFLALLVTIGFAACRTNSGKVPTDGESGSETSKQMTVFSNNTETQAAAEKQERQESFDSGDNVVDFDSEQDSPEKTTVSSSGKANPSKSAQKNKTTAKKNDDTTDTTTSSSTESATDEEGWIKNWY